MDKRAENWTLRLRTWRPHHGSDLTITRWHPKAHSHTRSCLWTLKASENSSEENFGAVDYIWDKVQNNLVGRRRSKPRFCIYISLILTPTPCVVPEVCFEFYEPGGLWRCPSARSGHPGVSWSHWDWPPNLHPPPAFPLQLQTLTQHQETGQDGLDVEEELGQTCVGGRGCHSWSRDFGAPGGSGTLKTGSSLGPVLRDASASSHSPLGTREGRGALGCCYRTLSQCPDQPLDTPAPLGL